MSVIIRLQNLPWSANALDIRQFFNGLSIPEGGVHIVGGELGDAFIAFSTDEDARQAFNLSGGKLKEVQVKLMLSSRTEMQKVIEAARNPLAAFMQRPTTTPSLPTLMPAIIPAAVPEIKKDDGKEKDKRERRRSRSRSRDRKDRSRDRERDRRDKRRRDRSRSRSRDRRDRRRRDRSHSRDRRSKERDRRIKERRHSDDKTGSSSNSSAGNVVSKEVNKPSIWEDPMRGGQSAPKLPQTQALLNTLIPNNLEEARRNLKALNPSPLLLNNRNGFPNTKDNFMHNRSQDDWNNTNTIRQSDARASFGLRNQGMSNNDQFNVSSVRRPQGNQNFGVDNQRMGFSRNMIRADGRASRFDVVDANVERANLLDRSHNENLSNSCVQLKPFFGGYGEIRRFFQGLFIHNTGIKFINDELGKRTGIVYIRFATPEGKQEALQRTGGHLKQNTVEVIHLDDNLFDKTVDRFHPDFKNQQEPEPIKPKNNPPQYNHSPPSIFSCLAVDDLPLFTKEQDMLKIFSDYSLLSIWLVTKQRHITAYIKFASSDEAKTALTEKAKQIFEGKTLNIRPCSDGEYSLATNDDADIKDCGKQKPFVNSDCVSLSGLPLKTSDRDVSDFFSDVAIVPNKIHLVNSNLGFTGQAYCEFASPTDAGVALEKNGLPLGSGTISVKSISRSEMESSLGMTSRNSNLNLANNQNRPLFLRNFAHPPNPRLPSLMPHRPPMRRYIPPPVGMNDMTSPSGFTVLMENVPYKAGLDEILEFFDGFDILPDNVLRRYNENGSPSGEAKVIFNSPEDAFQALEERHLCKIRDRTIYLSQC